MANIRTLTYGFDKTTRTYAKQGAAALRAQELVNTMQGTCNVQIVPVVSDDGTVRHTAQFSCFVNLQDAVIAARAGFQAFA